MVIRKAVLKDSKQLSELAYKSKAHWGYSEEFLEKCKHELAVTEEHIEQDYVYVLEDGSQIIGFYSLILNPQRLEAFFVDPTYIGKGMGTKLWEDMINRAEELQMDEFVIESDPNAEGFYLRKGAQRIGEIPSTLFSGRALPKLLVRL